MNGSEDLGVSYAILRELREPGAILLPASNSSQELASVNDVSTSARAKQQLVSCELLWQCQGGNLKKESSA